MIKINLMKKKTEFGSLSALGLDLSKIDIKLVLISVVVYYGSSALLKVYTQDIESEKIKVLASLGKEKQGLVKKIAQYKEIEKQIEEIIEQEKKLQKRKEIIEARIKKRKNPAKIMVYLSRNIPKDVWIKRLTLKGDRINIVGETPTYKSIGTFIENLKNSVYFDESVNFDGAETIIDKETKKRTEKFKISGKIARYN